MKSWFALLLLALVPWLPFTALAEKPQGGNCSRDFETNQNLSRWPASSGQIAYEQCIEPIGIQWQVFKGLPSTAKLTSPYGLPHETKQEAIDEAAAAIVELYKPLLDWSGNGCAGCGSLSETVAATLNASAIATSTYCANIGPASENLTPPEPGQFWSPANSCESTYIDPASVSEFNWTQHIRLSVYNQLSWITKWKSGCSIFLLSDKFTKRWGGLLAGIFLNT